MKKIFVISLFLVGCKSNVPFDYGAPQFDWMPSDLAWERNVRDCRSQPQCNPADLFRRT